MAISFKQSLSTSSPFAKKVRAATSGISKYAHGPNKFAKNVLKVGRASGGSTKSHGLTKGFKKVTGQRKADGGFYGHMSVGKGISLKGQLE